MKFVIPSSLATRPPPPAPPPKPSNETPASVRQADTKARLLKAGGKRVPFNLSAAALENIEVIKRKHGLRTGVDAVTVALHFYAKHK